MARHRINEDGHMMWFDTDEEYYAYLQEQEDLRKEQEEIRKRQMEEEEILKQKRERMEEEQMDNSFKTILKCIPLVILLIALFSVIGDC